MGQQTPSTVAATTLNLQGNVDPSHLQIAGRGNHRSGTHTEMLSVPSLHCPQDFRPRWGKSGHRPLFPQPSHSLSHLLDVHSLEAEELSPQRRLLHLHRHFRRLPQLPHPHALPEVPCLHSRRQALLLSGHAIWNKHRPSHLSLIASGAVKYLHNIGISASVSFDEWLLWNEFAESPYTSHVYHSQPPSEVGLHPQPKKSLLEPSPTTTYLGISWSGSVHTLLPSSKALEKVRTMALEILQLPSLPWKKYQRLLGSINFVAPYIKYGPLHLRLFILTSPNYKVKKSQPPSQPFPQHLRWWTRTQNLEAPVPMSIPPPNLTVWTRRLENRVGGGIFSGIHGQRRLVPRREPPPHKLPGMSSRDTISPLTEASTGVSSPGKDGQHCSGVPYQQTRVKQKQDLVSLPARASNTVRTEQIDNPIKAPTRPPQHMGRLPLSESPSKNGVSLSPQSFQQLRSLLYQVIDLFVHPGNAKLPAFGCPFPFPSATVVDALATNWYRWKRIYLFPPLHT